MDWALSVTGPKLSTAMMTGPMARKPKATRPKAKIGAANLNCSGIRFSSAAFCENRYATNMSVRMHRPIQNAQKLPATKPDRMFSDGPPWLDAVVISFTCLECVLTKIFVNSMMSGPASVPQDMMPASTHQRFGSASLKSFNNSQLAPKVARMETMEVSQTRFVSGCSQLNSFLLLKIA